MLYFPAQEEVAGLQEVMSESALASDPKTHRNMKETSASWLGATAPAGEAWPGAGSAESAFLRLPADKSWQLP